MQRGLFNSSVSVASDNQVNPSSSCRFLQMVTRTKKIFVGGLSANTVVEDVKQYFEQFGKVRGVWGWGSLLCPSKWLLWPLPLPQPSPPEPRPWTWLSRCEWDSAGAEMEEPGLWWARSPVRRQEQTERPLSAVSPALVGRVGPGPGADRGSAG